MLLRVSEFRLTGSNIRRRSSGRATYDDDNSKKMLDEAEHHIKGPS